MNALRPHLVPFVSLLILLALTCAGAYLPLGPGNLLLALAIAVAKTLLVAVFFMELRSASMLIRLVAFVGLVWLGILLTLASTDYGSRYPGELLSTPVAR